MEILGLIFVIIVFVVLFSLTAEAVGFWLAAAIWVGSIILAGILIIGLFLMLGLHNG